MMKNLTFLKTVAVSCLFSVSAFGQDMPAGNLIVYLGCNLADGATFADAVEYGRNQARDETSPASIFYRQPIAVNPDFTEAYDFRVALYYPSFAEWTARRTATPSQAVQRANTRRADVFTCDPGSRFVVQSRSVPGTDGFNGEDSMLISRFCRLAEGNTVADAFQFAQGVARNYRAAGNNSLIQVSTRVLGPVTDATAGSTAVFTSVGATAASMAERLDLAHEGMDATAGLETPLVGCNFPALWHTYAVHRTPAN